MCAGHSYVFAFTKIASLYTATHVYRAPQTEIERHLCRVQGKRGITEMYIAENSHI